MARSRSSSPRKVRVAVVNRSRCRLPSVRLLETAAGMALAAYRGGARGGVLATALVCVGETRMRKLNEQFTGRGELTDVLSFGDGEVDEEEGVLRAGDVIICSEAARRAARARGVPVRDELLLYSIHGWLHLAGFRDDTSARKRKMVEAERIIMKKLGFSRAD